MLQIFRKNKKGFTLIELLVVIAVIGLLSSIILVSIGPAKKKAKDTKRMTDFRQISSSMELCYGDPTCAGQDRYVTTTAGTNTLNSIGTFMPKVPCDPLGCNVGYTWTANASPYNYYCVYSKLEAETDTWVCASNKGVMKKATTTFSCTPNTAPCNEDCCGVNVK